MRSSFKINSNKNNNDSQWLQKKRKRDETSRVSLPGSSQKSTKRTKLTPDGKYNRPRTNEQFEDEDIQSSPQDLQIVSSPITLSPIKAPKSPTPSQLDPLNSYHAFNPDEVERIDSSPLEANNAPDSTVQRHDSISLLRQSNDEFLAAARRIKTTTPDKKRLSPSPLKLPSSQSPAKSKQYTSPPVLPSRNHRSQPVPRKLEEEFNEDIEDDIIESEEQVALYKQSKLMVSNIEEMGGAFHGDDIEDEIDFSPEPMDAVSKFSPLVKTQNEMLKQMKPPKGTPLPQIDDSIEESQDSQRLNEMLTMESVHRTPTKLAPPQPDVEDIEEHEEEDRFERSSPPAGQSMDHIADSPDHVPESPPVRRASPDVFENRNYRLLMDDVDDNDNDDIFSLTFAQSKEPVVKVVEDISEPYEGTNAAAKTEPQPQPQQQDTWNTADKIRGSFISPFKRTQQPVVLKEGLRIKPSSGIVPSDQTFLNKISVNSGQFTQFVPNEENTGRKGMSHLVKGGLAERMAKIAELDRHKRKQLLNQLKGGETLSDEPISVKVIKIKSSFNHLSVAKCKLATGGYAAVAFKHEKESAEVELPQIIEGTKLTVIPPYYSLTLPGQDSPVLMASLYTQAEQTEDGEDDMLSDEPDENSSVVVEDLLAIYALHAEYAFEPTQLVPLAKPTVREVVKEDAIRMLVQRVIVMQFADQSATGTGETPKKKSRGKPALSELCDGFFLNKLKHLQISQYNTDKSTQRQTLGARLVVQSLPNMVSVIDVRDVSDAVLQSESKWIRVKGVTAIAKSSSTGLPFGPLTNHFTSTDQFSLTVDTDQSGPVAYTASLLAPLDKLTGHQQTPFSVLGKVVFVDNTRPSLSMSDSHASTVYVTDGVKTVWPIKVKDAHRVSEGQVYLFVDLHFKQAVCCSSHYTSIEEVQLSKKSAVNYANTNALPGRRMAGVKEGLVREIGLDDTLCAALGVNIRALESTTALKLQELPSSPLSTSTVTQVAVKTTQIEEQLLCGYCDTAGIVLLAANTELGAALAITAQQPHFKCTKCNTIQSANKANKSLKVTGECRVGKTLIGNQVHVSAVLVDQWTGKTNGKPDVHSVVAKALESCLCKIMKTETGLRIDVIKDVNN